MKVVSKQEFFESQLLNMIRESTLIHTEITAITELLEFKEVDGKLKHSYVSYKEALTKRGKILNSYIKKSIKDYYKSNITPKKLAYRRLLTVL